MNSTKTNDTILFQLTKNQTKADSSANGIQGWGSEQGESAESQGWIVSTETENIESHLKRDKNCIRAV